MTTTGTEQQLLTADDLLRLYNQGVKGELMRGVLRETMSVGGEHGEVAMALGAALVAHVRPNRLGRVAGSDAGVLLERDPDTVREPDVAYFSAAATTKSSLTWWLR
jgi:Uma2 family endonuclease